MAGDLRGFLEQPFEFDLRTQTRAKQQIVYLFQLQLYYSLIIKNKIMSIKQFLCYVSVCYEDFVLLSVIKSAHLFQLQPCTLVCLLHLKVNLDD